MCGGARAVLTAACSACALPAESECLLCCQGGAEGACKVYLFNSTGYPLDEGTLCSKGYCSKVSGTGSNQVGVALPVHPQQSTAQGKCIQATTDLGTRLFGLLTNLTANELCECPHSLTSLSLSLLNCVTPPLTLAHTLPLPLSPSLALSSSLLSDAAKFFLENFVGCVLILSTAIWLLGLTVVKCILVR